MLCIAAVCVAGCWGCSLRVQVWAKKGGRLHQRSTVLVSNFQTGLQSDVPQHEDQNLRDLSVFLVLQA